MNFAFKTVNQPTIKMTDSTRSTEDSFKAQNKTSYDPAKVAAQLSAPNGAPNTANAETFKKDNAPIPMKSSYDDEIEHEELLKATSSSELHLLQSYKNPGRDWAMMFAYQDAIEQADKRIDRLKALREREMAAMVSALAQAEEQKNKKSCVVM
ncbi:hypothetical protein FKW77_009281 [Venturia effusa]|uniref:Uncharacterized protein n=1 Tax=Venturia effusa TaxID=50376 RepID=A0A517LCX7_9PEZI|nr:hypothetical protein FKW77_009281 [Venturia effusa]